MLAASAARDTTHTGCEPNAYATIVYWLPLLHATRHMLAASRVRGCEPPVAATNPGQRVAAGAMNGPTASEQMLVAGSLGWKLPGRAGWLLAGLSALPSSI